MSKRIFDIVIGLLALVLAFPLLVIISMFVRLCLGRPVIFRQQRPGYKSKAFTIYKFRTMKNLTDSKGQTLSDEKRMTAFGTFLRRTSMDELPEFWNVIKGDMSLVGPRPLLMQYLERYSPSQSRRHEVKPGITGWAQINGRNDICWDKKLELDVWYVDNRSSLLDIRILIATFAKVFARDGISKKGHASTDEFMGTDNPDNSALRGTCDWLIIGGGIVGLSIARSLIKAFPGEAITIIEKEAGTGAHASGRNSGVLHAGIYYSPKTLKAKLCVDGRRMMSEYCEEKGLKLSKIGKIILPTSAEEESEIKNLYTNAMANGVRVDLIGGPEVAKIEPFAYSDCQTALFSPDTTVVSPKEILAQLEIDLKAQGVQFLYNTVVIPDAIDTSKKSIDLGERTISYGYLINAAGAFADRIAHRFHVGLEYQIFPFRGSYYQLNPASNIKIKTNIYPVPDKKVPFLGVHFTPSVNGDVFIGPTAFPAFGREHYSGITGLDVSCTFSTIKPLAGMYWSNRQGFRNLVHSELLRLFKSQFHAAAKRLVPSIEERDIIPCKKRGIRAQLYDRSKKEIVMDFVVNCTPSSLHVLNAVSPAFTCGFSFADYLVKEFLIKKGSNW